MVHVLGEEIILTWRIHSYTLMRTVPIQNRPTEKNLDLSEPEEKVHESIRSKEMGVRSEEDAVRLRFLGKEGKTLS